jgi:hypothetical protein
MNRHLPLLLLSACLLLVCGCAQVQPWERGTLAKPAMAADPTPLQTMRRNHAFNSREGAAQVDAAGGGGGCGCY